MQSPFGVPQPEGCHLLMTDSVFLSVSPALPPMFSLFACHSGMAVCMRF
jgi:hypothetical protein